MTNITRILLFPSTTYSGIGTLLEGEQFAVVNGGKIIFYSITDAASISVSTSIQSAIDNGWVKEIRFGEVEPTLKVYTAGMSFHLNELFTDSSKSKFYIALQDFTATGNFEQDKENGYIKSIGETVYKQVEANVNTNDILVIPLQNDNSQYNKHCFIEKEKSPQSDVTILLSDFNETDDKWYYDDNWMTKDGQMYLKTSRAYTAAEFATDDNTQVFERTIDVNDYADIAYVGAVAL